MGKPRDRCHILSVMLKERSAAVDLCSRDMLATAVRLHFFLKFPPTRAVSKAALAHLHLYVADPLIPVLPALRHSQRLAAVFFSVLSLLYMFSWMGRRLRLLPAESGAPVNRPKVSANVWNPGSKTLLGCLYTESKTSWQNATIDNRLLTN